MIWILCVISFLFAGCQQGIQEQQYKEITVDTAQSTNSSHPHDSILPSDPHAGLDMSSMPMAPGQAAVNTSFSWAAPKGWTEQAGSGFRLATLHLTNDEKAIDCSIVSLGGMAGGLEANLKRWMGQLEIQATDKELGTLISSAPSVKIKSGQEAKIFDFTTIQSKANAEDKSMNAVMVSIDTTTLFVKMTGTVGTVKKNRNDFLKLVQSIEYKASHGGTAKLESIAIDQLGKDSKDPHAGMDMSAMGDMITAPSKQNLLNWTNPKGWTEEAGKHMRMATFRLAADPKAIDCSIIALAGPAGGLEANLSRWLGQLGLEASQENLNKLIGSSESAKTKDGLQVKVFDFSSIQNKVATDKSLLAAVLSVNETTVFVKMTGTAQAVAKNKGSFLELIKSMAKK